MPDRTTRRLADRMRTARHQPSRRWVVGLAAMVVGPAASAALLLPAGAHADAPKDRSAPGVPVFGSAGFSHPQDNPFFPLQPGLVTRLRGSEDGVRYREVVRVTHLRETIEGVRAHVIRDVLRRADGSLAERTADWYAADDDGNVWYLGERTATYDRHGRPVSREGSWRAGVDGARPGLIMPANPRAALAYRQEYYRGHAEDQAWLVGFQRSVRTPARRFHHVLRSYEWTRLEPGVMSEKHYAWGVGIVSEHDLAGGNESFSLVSVRR